MAYRDNFLKTFRDAIYHCVRWGGMTPQGDELIRARTAVTAAHRKLFFDYPWRYYLNDKRVILNDDFTDGSLAYDHTGGTSERLLTWTASDETALPTWARYGKLKFSGDDVIYKVQERLGDDTMTLASTHNPGSDVAAGTGFTLFRTEYPLGDVHRIHAVEDEDGLSTYYVPPEEWLHLERGTWTSGPPFKWTIMGAGDLYGQMALLVTGYPASRQSLDFICTRRPRRLAIDGIQSAWTTGTVSSASGTSVGISTNTFADEVVGAVVRLSRTSSAPTDVEEGNPFLDQRIITDVTNSSPNSTLTVDDTIDLDGVTVSTGYCVSDPVDVPEYLWDLFEAFCHHEFARIAVPERIKETKALLIDAQKQARARDKWVEMPAANSPWSDPAWALSAATLTSNIPAAYFQ